MLRKFSCAGKHAVILWLALALTAPQIPAQQPITQPPAAPKPYEDRGNLEELEDRSEDIANGILELAVAVREVNTGKIAEFFEEGAKVTPLPAERGASQPEVKWIQKHDWKFTPRQLLTASRTDIARQWNQFLNNFSEIEDVRFKLRASSFDETARVAKSLVSFFIVGRDASGHRTWIRATADTVFALSKDPAEKCGIKNSLSREEGRWLIREFSLNPMSSLVATADLFSEIAGAAGLSARIPAYGEAGNAGFVWHGATAADFNNDGLPDLFVTATTRNYLYLNDGKGRFRDVSEQSGVQYLLSGAGPLALDYDNDGDTDIFIASVGQQILFENRLQQDQKLEFRDVSLEAGVDTASEAYGFSATAADVNGDGYQDIYVSSYNQYGTVMPDSWFRATNGTPNLLFINQRNGTFREEAKKWGVADRRWSYAAIFGDVNGDHKQDLYVANDFGEKALFINKGDRFVDEASARGVLDPGNGMGAMFGDYNNDGLLDLHATNMSSTAGNRILNRLFPTQNASNNVLKKLAAGNNLFENLGNGVYKDVTTDVGGLSGMWAWGGGFIDFDNDGWEDLYTPNGFISGKSMADT
jgi:hypothetical protein